MSELRKYGLLLTTARAIRFVVYKQDGLTYAAPTFAAGDIQISKDGGAYANIGTLPTAVGSSWYLILSAAELTASSIHILISDQTATQVWLDTEISVETYGNASAMHKFDLDTASTPQTADHTTAIADIPTVAEFNARTLLAAAYFDPTADTVTVGTNNDKAGYSLTQSFPTNFASMVISAAGSVDSLVQGILNTLLTEVTAGRIAGNFDTFFENADAATTKTVDDVGGAGGTSDWTASERDEIRGRLGVTGTVAVGGNTPTLSLQADVTTILGRIIGTLAAGTHNPATAAQIAVLSDWINGGRLDLILDTIAKDTTTDIPLLLSTLQNDTDDIQTRLPTALVGGKMSSDAEAIAGSTDGATRLAKATQANVYATVGSSSTTTSIITSLMDPAAAAIDQFKGKIVTFDANTTTANLRGQSTDITANTAAGVLTVTALTTAPVSGDTFVIT